MGSERGPRKRGKTTAKSSGIPKIPQPHGGALNAGGTPGNAGGGRPPKAFKDFLSDLRNDPLVRFKLAAAAKGEGLPGEFKAALDVMVRYDIDKPAEALDVTLTDEQREAKVLDLLTQAKKRKERGLVS